MKNGRMKSREEEEAKLGCVKGDWLPHPTGLPEKSQEMHI